MTLQKGALSLWRHTLAQRSLPRQAALLTDWVVKGPRGGHVKQEKELPTLYVECRSYTRIYLLI